MVQVGNSLVISSVRPTGMSFGKRANVRQEKIHKTDRLFNAD